MLKAEHYSLLKLFINSLNHKNMTQQQQEHIYETLLMKLISIIAEHEDTDKIPAWLDFIIRPDGSHIARRFTENGVPLEGPGEIIYANYREE